MLNSERFRAHLRHKFKRLLYDFLKTLAVYYHLLYVIWDCLGRKMWILTFSACFRLFFFLNNAQTIFVRGLNMSDNKSHETLQNSPQKPLHCQNEWKLSTPNEVSENWEIPLEIWVVNFTFKLSLYNTSCSCICLCYTLFFLVRN